MQWCVVFGHELILTRNISQRYQRLILPAIIELGELFYAACLANIDKKDLDSCLGSLATSVAIKAGEPNRVIGSDFIGVRLSVITENSITSGPR